MLNHNPVGATPAPTPIPASDRQDRMPWAMRLRLAASPMVNTAGLIDWACVGFETERARGGRLAPFIAVLASGYGLGIVLAERVLRGEIMALVDDEAVVLLLDAENARIYEMEQRTRSMDAEEAMLSRGLRVDVDVDGHPGRRSEPMGEQASEPMAERVRHFCNEAPSSTKS